MKLDVRGEICPQPMLRTVEALNRLKPDEELDVLTDYAPALATISWQAAKRGYLVDVQELGADAWQLCLRQTEQALNPLKVVQEVAQQVKDQTLRKGSAGGT